MSYTPTNWNTGDTITASAMNKIENGIANAGGSNWDAVIRLTHANNTGGDTLVNLTPSIVSGTFAQLHGKISNGECPRVMVEYWHSMWGLGSAVPMAYITYASEGAIEMVIAGYSVIEQIFKRYGTFIWLSDGNVELAD